MKTARPICIVLAGLACMPVLPAPAFLEEYEIDFGQISEAGQEIIDRFAPRSFQDQYRFYTPEEVAATFTSMQTTLTGGSLEALAAARPDARHLLESLRANPNTQDYADWLEARMDYFDMAVEVEQAIPVPPASPTPPAPRPQPPRPPPPRMPQPVLIPHPAEPEKPAPSPPVLIPHPAEPPPPAAPPPAPKPAAPSPAVDQARNRYVENRQVWVRKLGNRPPPARAAALLPELKRIFREEGVPPEFVWQAEAESTFNPAARSPAGAVGLYQFMPATARQFGLQLSPRDERLDARKNARAAAQYLKLLHRRFGNWPLAFAAYNCGQGRVAAALRASGGATFDDIHDRLPAETRMYVPKIAALVQLRENADMERL